MDSKMMICPSTNNNQWSLKNTQRPIKFDPLGSLADNNSQSKRQNDVLQLIYHLARCQILFSVAFIIYGILKFEDYQSSSNEPDYGRMCAASLVAGCLGSTAGFLGLWAVYKFRWRGLMVAYLVAGILGSVAYLLLLIYMAAWMGILEKYDRAEKNVSKNNPDADSTTVFYVYLMALLLCVGTGVCFIISSAFICHLWAPAKKSATQSDATFQFISLFQGNDTFADSYRNILHQDQTKIHPLRLPSATTHALVKI